jgi:hypothetical protein
VFSKNPPDVPVSGSESLISFARVWIYYIYPHVFTICCLNTCAWWSKVGLPFSEKKNSSEHGRDGNFGSFCRNSVCSAERKMFGIPFRVIPRKIKNSEFCFYKMKSIVFVSMLSIPLNLIFPRNSFRSSSVPVLRSEPRNGLFRDARNSAE